MVMFFMRDFAIMVWSDSQTARSRVSLRKETGIAVSILTDGRVRDFTDNKAQPLSRPRLRLHRPETDGIADQLRARVAVKRAPEAHSIGLDGPDVCPQQVSNSLVALCNGRELQRNV